MKPPTHVAIPLVLLPRQVVYGPRRKRLPRPTSLGWAFLFALLLLLGGVSAAIVRANDDEETPRYAPASRGDRIAATEAVQRWRPLVSQYPWDVELALRILGCESEGRSDAINPSSGAAGLMQLYGWAWLARRLFGTGDVLIPEVNIGVAHVLWLDSGGSFAWHWAASRACWG